MKSAARSAIRVLAILATVWFGSTSAIAAYAYDAPHCANTINHAAYECGRPTNHTAATTPEAVHQWSHGAMACHDTAPTRNYSTYKLPASLAQDDGLAGSVRGLAEMVRAETSSLLVGPVAAKSGDEFVNLASEGRTTHILDGDITGGGHAWPGLPGKTPFPDSWSRDRIMHEISDVATDPSSIFRTGRGGSTIVTGTRDGVDIRVIIRNGDIVTGYPTNLPRN